MDNQPPTSVDPDNQPEAVATPQAAQPAVVPQPEAAPVISPADQTAGSVGEAQPVAAQSQPAIISSPTTVPASKGKGILIAAIALVVVLAAVAGALALHHKSSKAPSKSTSSSTSSNTSSNQQTGTSGIAPTNAKDAERTSDISSLQTQLETYFSTANHYPSLADINSPSWRATNMSTLNQPDILVDPASSCNPASSTCLVATPQAKAYAYQVTTGSQQSCENDDTQCANYTLTATLDVVFNGSQTYTKQSLNQ